MKAVLMLGLFIVISVSSFFVTLHLFPKNDTGEPREKLGEEVASVYYWLEKLRECQKDDAGLCLSAASQFILNIREAKDDKLYSNSDGLFNLFLLKNNLIYLKENCTSSDTAVDMFPVNYYPKNVSLVPEGRRKRGLPYFNHAMSFKKNGYRVDNICLLLSVLEVDGNDIAKLTTGQFQPKKGWKWNLNWKLSDR